MLMTFFNILSPVRQHKCKMVSWIQESNVPMLKSNQQQRICGETSKLHKDKGGTNLIPMSSAETIGNRFGVEIELLITSLPLIVLVFSHQLLDTVYEREMIALQQKVTIFLISQPCLTKWSQDLIIALTTLGQVSIAQASTVSKKHSNAPCCNKYQFVKSQI